MIYVLRWGCLIGASRLVASFIVELLSWFEVLSGCRAVCFVVLFKKSYCVILEFILIGVTYLVHNPYWRTLLLKGLGSVRLIFSKDAARMH